MPYFLKISMVEKSTWPTKHAKKISSINIFDHLGHKP